MACDVAHVVGPVDATVGCDQVAVAARKVGVLVVGFAGDLVGATDRVIEVAEKPEREALGLREGEVLRTGVERCTEDDDVEFVEAVGPVTQGLAFDRSTRGGSLRVPPQQHPVSGEVCAVDDPAVLVGQCERRRFGAWYEHVISLPVRTRRGDRATGSWSPATHAGDGKHSSTASMLTAAGGSGC